METLILSANYEPMARISWRRAITLWALDKVEILEAYTGETVASPSLVMETPAVARFKVRHHRSRRGVKLSRGNLHARDGGRCQYCGVKLTVREATLDHVMPRSRGGGGTWDNLVIACRPCNQFKADRTPEEAGMYLKRSPKRPQSLQELLWFTHRWRSGMPEPWRGYLPEA
ncbi:MAG: HNH endonuclease [Bradymonadia bacterium]